jgi:two-component system, LytTR family, sensor kinase
MINDKKYHAVFWLLYLAYITITFYLMQYSAALFPQSVIDIFVANLVITILPFYAFYGVVILLADKKKRVRGILLGIGLIIAKFLIENYGYRPFQQFLYNQSNDYSFGYMLGLSLSSDGKVLIFAMGFYFLTRYRKTEEQLLLAENEKLVVERKRLQAEVAQLKAQINPHFLHNVLNFFYAQAILISDKLAEGILLLSDIMRYALDKSEDEDGYVYVKKELGIIKKIIKINTLRFDGNIFLSLKITGDDYGDVKIIPMAITTLAENAFKHGEIHKKEYPVQMIFDYTEAVKTLSFTIINQVKKGPKETSHGIGMDNVKARLNFAYKQNASLIFEQVNDTYKATLRIKY